MRLEGKQGLDHKGCSTPCQKLGFDDMLKGTNLQLEDKQIGSADLMHNTVIIVNNTELYTSTLLRN